MRTPLRVSTLAVELLVAWAYFITENQEAEAKHNRRVLDMLRRKYSGRRFGRVRAELAMLCVPYVIMNRACPQPWRTAIWVGTLALFVGPTAPDICAYVFVGAKVRWGQSKRTAAARLAKILDTVDASALVERIETERFNGRHGYPPKALWRAYLASFLLGLPSTNALIRRLEDDATLRRICGFGRVLPHRTTFNRFITRLSRHQDLANNFLAFWLPNCGTFCQDSVKKSRLTPRQCGPTRIPSGQAD